MSPAPSTCVVLGATCHADASATLPLAIVIAAVTGAELAGVLVEEEVLAQFASGLVDAKGRRRGAVSAEEMRRAFERDARAFERQLHEAATARALRWRFKHRRGRARAALFEEAGAAGLILMSGEAVDRRVSEVVLLAGEGSDAELVGLAVELTRKEQCRLRVMTRGARRPGLPVPAQYEALASPDETRARLSALPAASLLIADLADADAELGPFLEHARFARLIRVGRG